MLSNSVTLYSMPLCDTLGATSDYGRKSEASSLIVKSPAFPCSGNVSLGGGSCIACCLVRSDGGETRTLGAWWICSPGNGRSLIMNLLQVTSRNLVISPRVLDDLWSLTILPLLDQFYPQFHQVKTACLRAGSCVMKYAAQHRYLP